MENVFTYPQKISFRGYDCVVKRAFYTTHPHVPSLQLVGAADTDYEGEPIVTATCNLAGYGETLTPGCCWLRTWSECEGLPEVLRAADIVGPEQAKVRTGLSFASECPLKSPPDGN